MKVNELSTKELREAIKVIVMPPKLKAQLLVLTYDYEISLINELRLRMLIRKLLNKVQPVTDRYQTRHKVSFKELDQLVTRQIDTEEALGDYEEEKKATK